MKTQSFFRITTKIAAMFAAALVLVVPARGDSGVGTTSADFLRVGVGARYLAMGHTGVATANDVSGLHWNPGQLSFAERPMVSFSYGTREESIRNQFGGGLYPEKHAGTFGIAAKSFSFGDIEQTDDTGASTGEFSPRDTAISLGWGSPVIKMGDRTSLGLGLTGKFVRSHIVQSDSTWAADVGAALSMGKLTLGAAYRNLGGKLQLDREESPLPRSASIGAAYRVANRWLLSTEANLPKDGQSTIGAGTEVRLLQAPMALFLRGGYNTLGSDAEDMTGATLGAGFQWNFIRLDYAWIPLGDLDEEHRVSVDLSFGGN